MPELVAAVLQTQQQPLRSLSPDVPPGLEAVVDRCLAKNPAARFANVGELAVALAPWGPPRSDIWVERITQVLAAARSSPGANPAVVAARSGGFAVSPVAGTAAASGAPTWTREMLPGRHRAWWVVVAGVVVVLGVGGPLAWRSFASRPSVAGGAPGVQKPNPLPSSTAWQPPSAPRAALSISQPIVASPPAEAVVPVAPGPSALPVAARAPQGPPRLAPHPSASSTQAASSATTPATNCNPPYTIDSTGMKHYKRECNN
jgi:serine/threonine-protein kinase